MNETIMNETVASTTRTRTGAATDTWLRVWPLRRPAVMILATGGVVLLAIWSGLGLLYMRFLDDGPVGDADRSVNRRLEDRRTPTMNTLSTIGSGLSDTVVKVILVAVVGTVMVAVWKRWHDGVFLATVVIFEASVFVLTSFVVGRERPPVEQLEEAAPSGSFPSGHSAAAVAFYAGLLVIGSWHTRNRVGRGVLVAVAVAVPVIVAMSRTYRGMHHPVDVIAGMLLGVTSLIVVRSAMEAGTRDIRDRALEDGRDLPDQVTHLDLTPGRVVDSIEEGARG